MPLENEVAVYSFLQSFGEGLLADLAAEHALVRSGDRGHHPLWLMGHLAYVGQRMVANFGGEPAVDPDQWSPMFGIGSEVSDDAKEYPTWNEVLGVWRDAHRRVPELAAGCDAAGLEEANDNPRMAEHLPTKGKFYAFVLTGHEALHLGQLSAWRRSQGMPRLF
jgi:hypothetical protein